MHSSTIRSEIKLFWISPAGEQSSLIGTCSLSQVIKHEIPSSVKRVCSNYHRIQQKSIMFTSSTYFFRTKISVFMICRSRRSVSTGHVFASATRGFWKEHTEKEYWGFLVETNYKSQLHRLTFKVWNKGKECDKYKQHFHFRGGRQVWLSREFSNKDVLAPVY